MIPAHHTPPAFEQKHVVPTAYLEAWLKTLDAAEDPTVPYNRDNNKMLAAAFDFRGQAIRSVANQLRNFLHT